MSPTSVNIRISGSQEHFRARESGNYFVEDTQPVHDGTEINIDVGEDVYLTMSVGDWRALAAAVEAGIEAIPGKREERLARHAERERMRAEFEQRKQQAVGAA